MCVKGHRNNNNNDYLFSIYSVINLESSQTLLIILKTIQLALFGMIDFHFDSERIYRLIFVLHKMGLV